MAFEAGAVGTSDREIKDYLHKNVGDFRPDWQSLYFDLMGFAGMGGVADIAKKTAVKALAHDFKNILRTSGLAGHGETLIELPSNVTKAFRNVIKGTRRAPQELLDPVKDIFLEPYIPGSYGQFNRGSKEIALNLDAFAKSVLKGDLNRPFVTLFHELGHGLQKQKGLTGTVPDQLREVHMEIFGDELATLTGKGTDLDMQVVEKIYDSTYEKARQVYNLTNLNPIDLNRAFTIRRSGQTPPAEWKVPETRNWLDFVTGVTEEQFDYSKVTSGVDDLIARARGAKKLTQEAYDLGREIHAGNVDRGLVEEAHKKLLEYGKVDSMDTMRSQYFTEAMELADILSGKPSSKIGWMKKIGVLPADFIESNF